MPRRRRLARRFLQPFFISRECISVQTLQPLIWLARRWTRLAVVSGTPAFCADALKAIRAFSASGTSTAMLVIRACMFSSAASRAGDVTLAGVYSVTVMTRGDGGR
jgi:hypothetical protein